MRVQARCRLYGSVGSTYPVHCVPLRSSGNEHGAANGTASRRRRWFRRATGPRRSRLPTPASVQRAPHDRTSAPDGALTRLRAARGRRGVKPPGRKAPVTVGGRSLAGRPSARCCLIRRRCRDLAARSTHVAERTRPQSFAHRVLRHPVVGVRRRCCSPRAGLRDGVCSQPARGRGARREVAQSRRAVCSSHRMDRRRQCRRRPGSRVHHRRRRRAAACSRRVRDRRTA